MRDGGVQFLWRNPRLAEGFKTGVCLHGHTLHSEECLWFLPRYLEAVPGVAQAIRAYQRAGADFSRAYWTPPLTPASALALERQQIAGLGLRPIVSLTDHDNIEAGLALQVTADRRRVPLSVEWTVPYEGSVFHLGIHNLPRQWMAALAAYTAAPEETWLPELLSGLAVAPDGGVWVGTWGGGVSRFDGIVILHCRIEGLVCVGSLQHNGNLAEIGRCGSAIHVVVLYRQAAAGRYRPRRGGGAGRCGPGGPARPRTGRLPQPDECGDLRGVRRGGARGRKHGGVSAALP